MSDHIENIILNEKYWFKNSAGTMSKFGKNMENGVKRKYITKE
jgi:hypothetical protein